MSNTETCRWALWLSFPLSILLTGASLAGLIVPSTYADETRLHAALSVGNDGANLVIIVPLLLAAAIWSFRGSLAARLIWMGMLSYLLYDFAGYALGAHFNSMFLTYCGILGLSFYALAGSLPALPISEIARRYSTRAPVKTTAIVLLLMSTATAYHWLSEILPALLQGRVPQAIRDSGLPTEPVAVLDLAFVAPACVIAAILLLRGKALGFVLGPIVLTLLALSSLVLAPMGMMMARRGFAMGHGLAAIGFGIGAVCTVLVTLSLRPGGVEVQPGHTVCR